MTAFRPARGRRFALAAAGLVAAALAAGCPTNPQITGAQLTGTVRQKDGSPLPGGEITVIGVDDPAQVQSGFIRADGKFEVPNVPVGEMKVTIDTHAVKGHPATLPGSDPAAAESAYGGKLRYVPIDKKYADPAKTPLRVTTRPGDNTQDFQVE